MSADQMAAFLGTLATGGVVALVAVWLAMLAGGGPRRQVQTLLAGNGLVLGSLFAIVATAGSLWFSEVADFPPCRLCWFQRIGMYPLAVLLPIAAVRRDRGMHLYGAVLALAGAAVSTYHILVQLYPTWESGSCDPTNPCTLRWVEGLGIWTIPRMALVAFLLVATALLADRGAASRQ